MARMPRPWYRHDKRNWYATVDSKQVSLGVTDPKDEAGAWAALRAMVSGAVAEAIAPKSCTKAGTLLELAAAFLEAKKPDVSPGTLKGYAKYLKWLAKHWGSLQVDKLDLVKVRAQSAGEEWSQTHRANTHWIVNHFLKWCGRTDALPVPPRESRGGDAVIPEETHRRILAETKGDFRALCAFLWQTGCRPGEATGLIAESVNWDSGSVTLKKHKTRHKGKVRTLHLSAAALQVLADQALKYDAAGLLFRGLRGKPFSLQAMTMRFDRVSEVVGRRVTSYMYRHTFATRALAGGESDTVVAALLGHSSTAMIHKHYSHTSEMGRALKDAANRIAG